MGVVIITGAGSGVGLAAVGAFAANGDRVVATARDPDRARERILAQGAADRVRVERLDVTESETFDSFVRTIAADEGSIDVLVNNAGVLKAGALEDLTPDDVKTVIDTNCTGPLLLARAVLPKMRQQGSGCIIMMSSLSGVAGLPGDVAYTAGKFGLEGATEALRHEVDRWGIRVALVEGGLYRTHIFDASLAGDDGLPAGYPADSPYRALVVERLAAVRERLPDAFEPSVIADLYVRIASSDEQRLRWPADEVAERVLATLFAHDDAGRDRFLRDVAGSRWWSDGLDAPPK